MDQNRVTTESKDAVFLISRDFSAPVDRVYSAWTENQRLARWWGPKDFELIACTLDFRRGGVLHYCLRDPQGVEVWGKWVITRILPGRRLEFIQSFCDETGGEPVRHPYDPDWPLEVASEVAFAVAGQGTRVEVCWVPLNASEAECRAFADGREACRAGWTGTFDRLENYLQAEERKVL